MTAPNLIKPPVQSLTAPAHVDLESEKVQSNKRKGGLGLALQNRGSQVSISTVAPGSSSHRAGLLPGDTILSIGGVSIQEQQEFYEVIGLMQAGDQIEVVIQRASKEETILLQIGEAIESNDLIDAGDMTNDRLTLMKDQGPEPLELNLPASFNSARISPESHESYSGDELREQIMMKELELLELQQQIEILKRKLATAEGTVKF